MNTEVLVEPEVATCGRLRLFSLYLDSAAAVRARWTTSQISRLAGERWKSTTEMWNLNSLFASDPIRTMITQDAAEADVVVVAMSSVDRRAVELIQWLDSLAAWKAKRPGSGLLVGLFGDEDQLAGELDWTLEQFLHCAQRNDRDFIWCWMGQEVMADGDWLADSVKALLSRKQTAADDAFLQKAAVGDVSSSP
jgi:FAD/FMN-containing dehydrogenase